jgi:lysozyme
VSSKTEKEAMIKQSTIDFIKSVEGVRDSVYKDSAGLDTIGVGHLLKKDEHFKIITDKEVDALLFTDLSEASNEVLHSVKVKLNQNQFDALCSLVFNIGTGRFRRSSLLVKINKNAPRAEIIKEWNEFRIAGGQVVAGLVTRRGKELKLFYS